MADLRRCRWQEDLLDSEMKGGWRLLAEAVTGPRAKVPGYGYRERGVLGLARSHTAASQDRYETHTWTHRLRPAHGGPRMPWARELLLGRRNRSRFAVLKDHSGGSDLKEKKDCVLVKTGDSVSLICCPSQILFFCVVFGHAYFLPQTTEGFILFGCF